MKFILLIKGEGKWDELSPEQMQSTMIQYRNWAGRLRDEGRLVDAEGLSKAGALITTEDGVITDGPFVETKEMVGGYYIFTAESLAEATGIAKQCPCLSYGGDIELRAAAEYD